MRKALVVVVLVAWSACIPTLVENPPRDASQYLPSGFQRGELDAGVVDVDAGVPANAGLRPWKQFFADPPLQQLIELALKNNQELNVRMQEIIIAHNEAAARRGEYLPRLSAGLGVGVEKVGGFTSQGFSDKATGVPEHLGNFGFGLTATWEVDVWGKLRNAAKSATARAEASAAAKDFMVTQLVAEIARTWYELCALDLQLEVLERNIALQRAGLEVVKSEKQAARVTELAVLRFSAELLKNTSRLYDLEQERVQAENRLNFLVGRFPQPVTRDAQTMLAPLPAVIESGLPSQLLKNRPDVRQAELEIEASKLDVKAAWASFFPALSLDAGLGYNSFNLVHLVTTPESLLYNLAGNLTAPLLNRAAIEAQYRSANARQLQAVFSYERTLLQSFTEVANLLATYENVKKRYELEQQQVEALKQSVEVSNVLFQSARADYMEVLLTRRDSLDAELELIETKRRLLHAMVNLYQALGGGWEHAS